MTEAKPQPTPMVTSLKLTVDGSTAFHDPTLYRQIVGALQYLTFTRPDITYAVNKVSQYMHNPQIHHWKAVKRLLRYVAGTHAFGIRFTSSTNQSIHGFADADWGADIDDRKSTTGYCVYLGDNIVSWSSKKQKTVSRSSTEAESRSIASITIEISWLNTLLRELKLSHSTPVVYSDNLGSVLLTTNPIMHSKTKHFAMDVHFV